MLARSCLPITAAAITLFLLSSAASAVTINFAKVQVNYKSQNDADKAPNHGVSVPLVPDPSPGLPPPPPVLVFTQGLASWTDSTGTQLRRYPTFNLGSSGEGVTTSFLDTPPGPPAPPPPAFPAVSFFDIFTEISIPTSGGTPTLIPDVLREFQVHNIGSSGQDGIAIDLDVVNPTDGSDIFMTETLTPTNPGATFHATPTASAPTFVPDVPGTYQSFFDIFLELDATQSFDPNTPMFRTVTTITPEPTSLILLALSATTLLTRRRRSR